MYEMTFITILLAVAGLSAAPISSAAQETQKAVQLPAPQTDGGKPLMQVLKARHSTREFSPKAIDDQTLSNLLWAAFGINREDGKRTAPSARNFQETDLYVARADGVYLYDAKANRLEPVAPADLRAATGMQDYVKDAPIDIIYVADTAKMSGPEEEKTFYSATDAGFIAENAYLFCASEGLAVVVRGSVDRAALAKAMKLRPEQKIILAQTVGHPK